MAQRYQLSVVEQEHCSHAALLTRATASGVM